VQKYENGVDGVGSGSLFKTAEVLGIPVGRFFEDADYSGNEVAADSPNPDAFRAIRAAALIDDPELRRLLVEFAGKLAAKLNTPVSRKSRDGRPSMRSRRFTLAPLLLSRSAEDSPWIEVNIRTKNPVRIALGGNIGCDDRAHFKSESSTIPIATPPAVLFSVVAVLAVTTRGFELGHNESVFAQLIKRLRGCLGDDAFMFV
jgi:hypothetical protein